MATNNMLNVSLSGQTGTGSFLGSASATFTGTPLLVASPYSLGIVSDWVAYVPTLTGFGASPTTAIWSRRRGDTLDVRGLLVTATPTATEARMTLGFNGTDSNITSSNTVLANISLAGNMVSSVAKAGAYYVLIEKNTGYVTFSFTSSAASGLTKQNANAIFGSSNTLAIYASIPVDSWP